MASPRRIADLQAWLNARDLESVRRFGIDYAVETYPDLQQRAAFILWSRLETSLERKVPSRSITASGIARLETVTSLAESYARRRILLYLRVPPEVLREGLQHRLARFGANAAFPIHDDLLGTYLKTFQEPSGEGEFNFG
jgi:hypothetical protein